MVTYSGHVSYTEFFEKPEALIGITIEEEFGIHEAQFVHTVNGTPMLESTFDDWSIGNSVVVWAQPDKKEEEEKTEKKKKKKKEEHVKKTVIKKKKRKRQNYGDITEDDLPVPGETPLP